MSDDSTSHAIDERYSAVYHGAVELVDPPFTPSNHPGNNSAGYRPRKSSAVVASERAEASERKRSEPLPAARH